LNNSAEGASVPGGGRKYRAAVVGGAGTWGRHYLAAYADHPSCELVALVDRARDRRQVFADHFGIRATYDTVEDLLRREVPDIVSIVLPVAYSGPAVIACAEAGVKAISCEKPIAASLHQADEMVRVCRERGAALGCSTVYWEAPCLVECAQWIQEGHIGQLTAAAIPRGLPNEMSGGGCLQLAELRLLTGMEVEWVEGWTLPPPPGHPWPDDVQEEERDCPGYGRLGLSGGITCEIPEPRPSAQVPCRVSVVGEEGQVWAGHPRPVLVVGRGATSTPVYPRFLRVDGETHFRPAVDRLVRALETGEEALCSGHDFRQVLEVAIALNLSAQQGHRRVSLPLEDRSLRIMPQPYRWKGGDEAGWASGGYKGPPGLPRPRTPRHGTHHRHGARD